MTSDKMILGENVVYSTDPDETGLNNNVIVCGSSGSGKTMSIVEPILLETFHSSLIVTVTKRKIVKKYASVFSERGYTIEELNFVEPTESTVSYDPLQFIASYADILFLAESIVYANPRKERSNSDPYWDEAAVSLLCALIAVVLGTIDNASFADVLKLLSKLSFVDCDGQISTSLDSQFAVIAKKDPNGFALSCWKSFRKLPIKTASCVFSTLNATVDKIFNPELRQMIEKPEKIDLEALASQKTILFISSSAVNPALTCFINMFYAQAFKTLFEYAESFPDGKLPIPVRMLCDDFATGGRILNFPEYISIFREKGISTMLLLQSESQLESMYGNEDAITIINNCDTYIYMGGMDIKTGRSVSERLNLPLDEVLYMPLGQIFVFRRGQKPIITTRYDILKNKEYQKITDQYEKWHTNDLDRELSD